MSQTTDAGIAQNPYASPVNDDAQPAAASQLDLASNGQRFLTFLIDYVGMTMSAGAINAVLVVLGAPEVLGSLVGIAVMIGYYGGFEAACGKTPGKMLVGTRVVTLTGSEPSFGQCMGRTFARWVPCEPFSFFGSNAVGWHDKWTETRVVRAR